MSYGIISGNLASSGIKSLNPNILSLQKSYKNVQEAINERFNLAKLKFFSFVSDIVEPFLKQYQLDKPMIPFMYENLKDLVSRLLELFVNLLFLKRTKLGRK